MGQDGEGDLCPLFLAGALVMEDHEVLCRARQQLAEALCVLLKAGIMDATDFGESRYYAMAAIEALDDLLCRPHRHQA